MASKKKALKPKTRGGKLKLKPKKKLQRKK